MKAMLGFFLKRQLLTLINDETDNPASALNGVRAMYSPTKDMPREAIFGLGGISSLDGGDAEGTLDVDKPRASIAVRVTDSAPELGAWTTDERAEAICEAIGNLVAANRHLAGGNTVASVRSYQWSNPSTDTETVTLAIMEVGIEGYV